jgi:1-acyl-sn-glycerol-3-phosphate acyltransferase
MKGQPSPAEAAAPRRFHERLFYDTLWVLCRTLGVALLGIRFRFAEPLPASGGLLVLSSHQSLLDPLILGLVSPRRLASLARSSLFRWRPFAAVISALDAVPIDRDASQVATMKAVIRKLQQGAAMVIYPEGTRTSDGTLGEVKGGFALIAKRAGVPIVPAVIVGAWECWPRARSYPLPGRVRVEFGEIISTAEIAAMDDAALVAEVRKRLADLDREARRVRAGLAIEPSPRRAAMAATSTRRPSRGPLRAKPTDQPRPDRSTAAANPGDHSEPSHRSAPSDSPTAVPLGSAAASPPAGSPPSPPA